MIAHIMLNNQIQPIVFIYDFILKMIKGFQYEYQITENTTQKFQVSNLQRTGLKESCTKNLLSTKFTRL